MILVYFGGQCFERKWFGCSSDDDDLAWKKGQREVDFEKTRRHAKTKKHARQHADLARLGLTQAC